MESRDKVVLDIACNESGEVIVWLSDLSDAVSVSPEKAREMSAALMRMADAAEAHVVRDSLRRISWDRGR